MADPIYRRGPDGSHRFIYENEEIVIAPGPPDRLGRRAVDLVTSEGHFLGRDLVNLSVDSDRHRLALQAGNRDGVTADEWDDRILAVSVRLDQEVTASSEWPPLVPLLATPPTPGLDAKLIHPALRTWLTDITDRASIPLEYAAAPAYVALSSTVGRHVGIMPVRFDRYLVVSNLWGGIVGRPSTMKSSAVQEALDPLNRLAATARERFRAAAGKRAAREEAVKAEMGGIKVEMRQAATGKNDIAALEQRLAEKMVELEQVGETERRYLTQDATIEKLGELLRDNPRGLLVFRDELAGWLRNLDKPGRDGDREFFLEAWNGTGDYTVDRIGRGTVYIPAITVSIVGGIQPGKLEP